MRVCSVTAALYKKKNKNTKGANPLFAKRTEGRKEAGICLGGKEKQRLEHKSGLGFLGLERIYLLAPGRPTEIPIYWRRLGLILVEKFGRCRRNILERTKNLHTVSLTHGARCVRVRSCL